MRPFSNHEQLLLTEKICCVLFENGIINRKNSNSVFENIKKQIVEMFPFEKSNEVSYYHKIKNFTGGVLYHKYQTIKKRYKSLDVAGVVVDNENDTSQSVEEIVDSEQTELALEWLGQNRCPTSHFYDKLNQCWSLTSFKRKPCRELMSIWIHYKLSIGHIF